MCWPLSSSTARPSGSVPGSARARPPRRRAASNTITRWPAPAAVTAAAMPAQPPPTIAPLMRRSGRAGGYPSSDPVARPRPLRAGGRSSKPPSSDAPSSETPERLDLPGQPELAQRRQADALVQHRKAVALDLAQQREVDAGHHQPPLLRAAIGGGQQRQRALVGGARALGLEPHQRAEALGKVAAVISGPLALEDFVRLHAELLQLRDRQVDAPAHRVLADVADDVGEDR